MSRVRTRTSKYTVGTLHGIYEVVSNVDGMLAVKCTVCGRIHSKVMRSAFHNWNKEACHCDGLEKCREIGRKGSAFWSSSKPSPEPGLGINAEEVNSTVSSVSSLQEPVQPDIAAKKKRMKLSYEVGRTYGTYKVLNHEQCKIVAECIVCHSVLSDVSHISFRKLAALDTCNCKSFNHHRTAYENRGKGRKHPNIVRKSKSLTNGGFETNIFVKSSLQRSDMYGSIVRYGIYGDALILAGPDIVRHITDSRATFGSKGSIIHIVENNPDVFSKQIDTFNSLELPSMKDKVILTYGDLINLPAYQVIDADLMGTFVTEESTIVSLLKKQMGMDCMKAFIFTLSEHGSGLEKTVEWISKYIFSILDRKSEYFDKVPLIESPGKGTYKFLVRTTVEHPGRIIDLLIYHYADDKGPMLSCCMIYK